MLCIFIRGTKHTAHTHASVDTFTNTSESDTTAPVKSFADYDKLYERLALPRAFQLYVNALHAAHVEDIPVM
jgi:hypothetical protein